MKIGLTQLFLLISLSFAIYAQDTTSLTLHSMVGDSIDQTEKEYYQLFKHYHPSEFEFAKYLSVDEQIIVLVKLKGKPINEIQYGADDLFHDMQLVGAKATILDSLMPSEVAGPQKKLYLVNDGYRKKLRKGKRLWVKTYSGFEVNPKRKYKDYTLVKVLKSSLEDDKTLSLRTVNNKRRNVYLPVEDIQSIRYYSTERMILQKVVGSTMIMVGLLGVLPYTKQWIALDTGLFVLLEGTGLVLLLERNRKFEFDRDARFVFK